MISVKIKDFNNIITSVNIEVNKTICDLKTEYSKLIDHKLDLYYYTIMYLGKILNDNDIIIKEFNRKVFNLFIYKKPLLNYSYNTKNDIRNNIDIQNNVDLQMLFDIIIPTTRTTRITFFHPPNPIPWRRNNNETNNENNNGNNNGNNMMDNLENIIMDNLENIIMDTLENNDENNDD